MTEAYGDVLTAPFWVAAEERRLTLQRCRACASHQFYPRPFCLQCEGTDLEWVDAAGTGTIYSAVRVHLKVIPELAPPYFVAVVELTEGPRITSNIIGDAAPIGANVRVQWRDRDGMPPLPVFSLVG
ncbi:MAG: Zn-ribbon domain-containing OB-fold protein [Candidatus Dormibacteria bacterium]